jgi:hypothetical protein
MELLEGSAGIITRLENKVSGLPEYEAQRRQTITEKRAVLSDVASQAGKPFKLVTARAKCAELNEKLKASIDPPKPAPSAEAPTQDAARSRPGAGANAQTARSQLPVSTQEHAPDTVPPDASRAQQARLPDTHATAASKDDPMSLGGGSL